MTSEDLDEGRDVIIENDNYLFMEILNAETARYFGKDDIAYLWGRKYREGHLYYLIDKKFRGDSTWIHIPHMSSIEIETFDEEVLTLSDLLRRHSFIEKFIMDKVNPFDMSTYYALKAIAQGVPTLSDWTMQNVDDLISNFKYILERIHHGNKLGSFKELIFLLLIFANKLVMLTTSCPFKVKAL